MQSLTNKNAIPELVELLVRSNVTDNNDAEVLLKVDLRIGNAEIETNRARFTVSVKILTLGLALDGIEIAPASRFGEPIKNNSVSIRNSSTKEQKHKAAICGKVGGLLDHRSPSASIELHTEASGELSSELKKEISEETAVLRVKAVSNDRWIISEPDGSILADTYLNDEHLCRLTKVKGANRTGIMAKILARQRDLEFKVNGIIERLTVTQSKLFSILLAKSINSGNNAYKGHVHLSESEVEHED